MIPDTDRPRRLHRTPSHMTSFLLRVNKWPFPMRSPDGSGSGQMGWRFFEKSQRNFQNPLDKHKELCYNGIVNSERASELGGACEVAERRQIKFSLSRVVILSHSSTKTDAVYTPPLMPVGGASGNV